jgi:hypothetical protein
LRTRIVTISVPAAVLTLSLAARGTGGPTGSPAPLPESAMSPSVLVDDACIAYDKAVLNEDNRGNISERKEAGGVAQQLADEFVLTSDAAIQGVSWSGSYYQANLPATTTEVDFRIRFFDDAGGRPDPMPVHDELVTAQVTNDGVYPDGYTLYLFEAEFASPVTLSGGATHWISILEEDPTTPYFALAWRWAVSATGSGDLAALRNSDGSAWILYSGQRANESFQLQVCQSEAAAAVDVGMDIKPGSDENPVNPGSRGNIPVAILTTGDFDAGDVDPSTVTLGNDDGDDTPVAARRNGTLMASLEDVDDDGDLDLMLHFSTQALVANGDLDQNTTQLILNGETTVGQAFKSSNTVKVVPQQP